jgi:hypothetical protein
MKDTYGDVKTTNLRLVRAMSENELQAWQPTASGQLKLASKTNAQKGEEGDWLEELGFSGKTLASRNTLHFTLNCAVEDHAYGSFDKDVLFVLPFTAMLEKQKPSSFSEVDVVFPFDQGEFECPMPRIFVREGVSVPEGLKPHTTYFAKDAEVQDVIKKALNDEHCEDKRPSLHGWSEGSQTLSEEGVSFIQSLGPQTVLSSHSNSVEGRSEWAVASFAGAARQVFSGNTLYDDSYGRTREYAEKINEAMREMAGIEKAAPHPLTREHARKMHLQMEKVQAQTVEFEKAWTAFVENPLGVKQDQEKDLLSQVPESCQQVLKRRLEDLKRDAAQKRSAYPSLEEVLNQARFQPSSRFTPPPLPKEAPPPPRMRIA